MGVIKIRIKLQVIMPALVIKFWKASDVPFDDKGSMVLIQGREGGVIAWLLALAGVDPISTWRITRERIEIDARSWAGTQAVIVPLENVDFIFYGYHKPWKQALVLFLAWVFLVPYAMIVLSMILGWRGDALMILAYITAIPAAVLYYLLARSFRLGFAVAGGREFDMKFKRSIIENQEINAKEGAYVCEMLDYLCDCRRHLTSLPAQ